MSRLLFRGLSDLAHTIAKTREQERRLALAMARSRSDESTVILRAVRPRQERAA